MAYYDIVEGTSGTIEFQLLEQSAPIDLTGISVSLLINDRTGSTVSSPGSVTVVDAANGKVQFTPTNSSTFVGSSGPYYVRWVLTNGSGAVSYVPTSLRDVWNVVGL